MHVHTARPRVACLAAADNRGAAPRVAGGGIWAAENGRVWGVTLRGEPYQQINFGCEKLETDIKMFS